jgi:peptidoglycan/xylan/chitin deacetylase (PgdA/CDA1 family)
VRELLARRSSQFRLVGLTFDDGYADFARSAMPILAEFGFTATVFPVAGGLGGSNEWDQGPRRPLMTGKQLESVHAAGHEVGSHGMRHVPLVSVPPERRVDELIHSKSVLEQAVQAPVTGYCYPYGRLSPETVAAVREVYDYGCAVAVRPLNNPWALPRFHVGDSDGPLALMAKLALRPLRERIQASDSCE